LLFTNLAEMFILGDGLIQNVERASIQYEPD